MALSINQLSEYLSQEDFRSSKELTWRLTEQTGYQSLPWKGDELPCNGLSCLSVVCYVLKLCSDSKQNGVIDTIKRLNDLASEYNKATVSQYGAPEYCSGFSDRKFSSAYSMMKLASNNERMRSLRTRERSLRYPEKRREIAETFVNTFLPKVQQFFVFDHKGNEHLAGFIHFLLQILNSESSDVRYEGLVSNYVLQRLLTVPKRNGQLTYFLQKILNGVSDNTRYKRLGSGILQKIQVGSHIWLQRSLNFIFTVLGDVPFQFSDVKNLLREFEVVANEAGSLIYACFFRTCPVNACQFSEHVVVLSHKLDLLNVKIQEHCIEISKLSIPICDDPVNTNAADSQFIMDSLLEDLNSFMTSQNDLTSAMKQQTSTLHEELLTAQAFLKDTNMPEVKEIQELRIQIRDTAFEAEYFLNSFVVGDFPVSYFSLRLPMIIEKFELIREECKEIKTISDIKALKVKDDHIEFPTQKAVLTPPDNVIVGFEDEAVQILDELTGGSGNLKCICIYGMPGLGKTTLAKRLYNHRLVTDRFDECAWCVATQTYQKRNVLIEILKSLRRSMLDKEKIMEMDDESLLLEVYKTLFSRRYLIVIDDVWDSRIWNDLGRYFRNSGNGSRILFTTRIRDTAPKNSIFHTLNFLSKDQCWELLEKKIFLDESCPPHLQDSGKRIAAKCNGLPLAVVAIAGALSNMKNDKSIWDKVEESLDSYTSDCMQILELSFNHLPNHLKMCFLSFNLLHLKYLVVDQTIQLPALANLANLEVLRVDNESVVDVSAIISKMVKLRHLHVKYAAFIANCNSNKPHNLRSLSNIYMCNMDDYENLRSLPSLKNLKCQNLPLVPDLCFLTELESLEIGVSTHLANIIQTIKFPSTVKKLNLSGTQLPWETISVLGKLPELQSLKLFWDAFKGKEWTTSDDEFQKLKFLEIGKLEIEQWITLSEHFPRLHHLVIVSCNKLQNIPAELGDISTLHTIEVHECSYEASISAFRVEQEQCDNGNKDLQVIIANKRWSKEELALKYKQMDEEHVLSETQSTSSSAVGDVSVLPQKERTIMVHTEVLCDYCGMSPIVGERYKCKDCKENIGYDLCGYCYSSSSSYKLPGRYNQRHTSDHNFEIVTPNLDH